MRRLSERITQAPFGRAFATAEALMVQARLHALWCRLTAFEVQTRPMVWEKDAGAQEQLQEAAKRVKAAESMGDKDRLEYFARREHEHIQQDRRDGDAERDGCAWCCHGWQTNSKLSDEYDPRLQTMLLTCRSWAEPCCRCDHGRQIATRILKDLKSGPLDPKKKVKIQEIPDDASGPDVKVMQMPKTPEVPKTLDGFDLREPYYESDT